MAPGNLLGEGTILTEVVAVAAWVHSLGNGWGKATILKSVAAVVALVCAKQHTGRSCHFQMSHGCVVSCAYV